tara:strand:- start:403 stop:963 length:561 start_codon:yes stop_codon:yes gene_type:complete
MGYGFLAMSFNVLIINLRLDSYDSAHSHNKYYIMEITLDIAQRIIEGTPVLTEVGVPYKGIEVTHVGFTDADGTPFEYESGDQYAIVSLKAYNEYQFENAVAAFVAEDYDEAVAKSLSVSMTVDKAREIQAKSTGTVILQTVMNSDDVEIIVVRSFVPAVAVDASKMKRSLTAMLAKPKLAEATAE